MSPTPLEEPMIEICRNVDWRDRKARCSGCKTDRQVVWMSLAGPVTFWCKSCVPRDHCVRAAHLAPNTERVALRVKQVRCSLPYSSLNISRGK